MKHQQRLATIILDAELSEVLEALRQRQEDSSGFRISFNNYITMLLRSAALQRQEEQQEREET